MPREREKGGISPRAAAISGDGMVLDPVESVMEQVMVRGIKERAEPTG